MLDPWYGNETDRNHVGNMNMNFILRHSLLVFDLFLTGMRYGQDKKPVFRHFHGRSFVGSIWRKKQSCSAHWDASIGFLYAALAQSGAKLQDFSFYRGFWPLKTAKTSKIHNFLLDWALNLRETAWDTANYAWFLKNNLLFWRVTALLAKVGTLSETLS